MLRRLGECSKHAARTATIRPATGSWAAQISPVSWYSRFSSSQSIDQQLSSDAAAASRVIPNLRDAYDLKPSTSFLKARLLEAIEHTRSNGLTDESALVLLQAVHALRDHEEVLQPYMHTASVTLSKYFVTHPVPDEHLAALQAALGQSCLIPQNVSSQLKRYRNETVTSVSSRYADWLMVESRRSDSPRRGIILSAFEEQLRRLSGDGKSETRLVLPLVAAWGILNAQDGRSAPSDLVVITPHHSTVLGWIERQGVAQDLDVEKSITALCSIADSTSFPTSVDRLSGRLSSLRNRGKIALIADLWEEFATQLGKKSSAGNPFADPAVRNESLAAFLTSIRQQEVGQAPLSAEDREKAAGLEKEMRKRIPRPMPLPILHALLLTAQPPYTGKTGTGYLSNHKDGTLAAARDIWDSAKQEGVVRDSRAYGIYLGLLGRYHEGPAMFKIWDEIVHDDDCRKLEAQHAVEKGKEGKDVTSWPPTVLLNQLLSSAYMIGSKTAEMAFALFQTSLDPKSPITPDLFTLNIALRHAAHQGSLPLISEVISAAGPLGLTPDIVTYTTLIQGLLRADRPDLARQTIESMKTRGMEPNERMASMLVAHFSADGNAKDLLRAEEVIRDMKARGIRTTVPMWTSLIAGYFRGNWELDGWSALERMSATGLSLNEAGYNVILRNVLSSAKRTPNVKAWRAIDKSTRDGRKKQEETSLAIKIFRHMRERRVQPTTDTYSILLAGLNRTESARDIREVLRAIRESNFQVQSASLERMIATGDKIARGVSAARR